MIRNILTALCVALLPLSALAQVTTGGGGGNTAQGAANAGQAGSLALAVSTTSAPAYTNNTVDSLSLDTTGNLRVTGGVAQGSTTSSQTGSLIMGAVTTSAPSYTTAQTSPLSLDLAGNLRTTPSSVQASATAKGGSITAGGTSQTAIASNSARKAFVVQNPCNATEQGIATAEDLYVNLTNAASASTNANLAVLSPCASFSMGVTAGLVSTEAVTIIAATTAHIFYAKEF